MCFFVLGHDIDDVQKSSLASTQAYDLLDHDLSFLDVDILIYRLLFPFAESIPFLHFLQILIAFSFFIFVVDFCHFFQYHFVIFAQNASTETLLQSLVHIIISREDLVLLDVVELVFYSIFLYF